MNENAVPEDFVRALLSLRQASHLPHILLEEVATASSAGSFYSCARDAHDR